jgi:fumarylacetoacetase
VRRGFGRDELPYGVFAIPGRFDEPRVGVAVGDEVLDLSSLFDDPVFRQPSLNAFMAQGRAAWTSTRAKIRQALEHGASEHLTPADDVVMALPFEVADFVDFNSSLQHATNAGKILRPGDEPVRSNWRRMPVGYHGRTGTVVVSGTPIDRPNGQYRDADGQIVFGPTRSLDVEAELGFVVGCRSMPGMPIPTAGFADYVFGVVPVLDWSARDIQAFETVPLGPFLGKSFATTIGAWVLPLEALQAARVPSPVQQPPIADYLHVEGSWGFDVRLELSLNGGVIARPRFDSMYWTPPQQLAHLTVNGACVRTGDLFASGTVSDADEFGSLLELTWNGTRPLTSADGSMRGYLADGDEVSLTAIANGTDGARLRLSDVRGVVRPARRVSREPAAP